jgi:hypothetical protein
MQRVGNPKIAQIVLAVFLMSAVVWSASTSGWRTYSNRTLNVEIKYPPDWHRIAGFSYRYGGKDGFFQLNAAQGEALKVDQAAKNEANQRQRPYGSNPTITSLKVAGQEARLIMPSADQPKDLNMRAAVVVRMPEPCCIGSQRYTFLVLWADKEHIRTIADTLKFLPGLKHC